MKNTILVFLFLIASSCFTLSQEARPQDSGNWDKLVGAHQEAISLACGITMTNILKEFTEISSRFKALNNIESATVQVFGFPPSYQLLYNLGQRSPRVAKTEVIISPATNYIIQGSFGASGPDPKKSEKNEVELGLFLCDKADPIKMRVMGTRHCLLRFNGHDKLTLYFFKQLNASDAQLNQALDDIVGKNIGVLTNTLQKIVGIDPAAEKARACGAVMTNILNELQALAQQYTRLSNLNSATIKTEGTNYLYQHLHYWNKAHFEGTNNLPSYKALFPDEQPMVEKGGLALDVFVWNEGEPFNFRPNNSYEWVSPDHKTLMDYRLYFNARDHFFDDKAAVASTEKAIRQVIETERSRLRRRLNDIIDF